MLFGALNYSMIIDIQLLAKTDCLYDLVKFQT